LSHGREGIAALDAEMERWRAIFEVGVEVFLVSFILRKFGTRFSLTSSAGAIFGGLAVFALLANPFVVLFTFHADELIRHSWFKSAKELTYTVTSRSVVFSVKPVIEMFFYRFSRGLAGVAIFVVNSVLGLGSAGILTLGMITAAIWGYCGWRLAGEFARLEAANRLEKSLPERELATVL
jgi:AAA family ATP:ADP antiporter